MRIDRPELPWYDIRVRHALFKAVDRQAILRDYFKGDGELLTELVAPTVEFKDIVYPAGADAGVGQGPLGV